MKIQTVETKNMIVKSNLPASDYVINPYVGCSHRCRYCYASFMKRFTGHAEEWGSFVDIKHCPSLKPPRKITGKTLLLSSVTDPYQPLESKYGVTGKILQRLLGTAANVEILTKSHLVTRDINLFLQFSNIRIGISMNTLDDSFRRDMEPGASSVAGRLKALQQLQQAGLSTYLFVSPIFPGLSNLEQLITEAAPYVSEICFENLNLRGAQKEYVLSYVKDKYASLVPLYHDIYLHHSAEYWKELEWQIQALQTKYSVKLTNYFYHDRLKKTGKENTHEYTIS
ncbi:MAG: radical SAM protein [Butyrivibrio sp.]|nr:radical SAM protein [Acetatifactor muris]MCM1561675.1 radical SAM protein [Butyrivibrio sp.]